jgi:hypothetical protein
LAESEIPGRNTLHKKINLWIIAFFITALSNGKLEQANLDENFTGIPGLQICL